MLTKIFNMKTLNMIIGSCTLFCTVFNTHTLCRQGFYGTATFEYDSDYDEVHVEDHTYYTYITRYDRDSEPYEYAPFYTTHYYIRPVNFIDTKKIDKNKL